jgi:hypothetical protein
VDFFEAGPGSRSWPARRQRSPTPARAAPPPPARPKATYLETKLAHLKELAQLKEQGILTDAEFEAQKSRVLNG